MLQKRPCHFNKPCSSWAISTGNGCDVPPGIPRLLLMAPCDSGVCTCQHCVTACVQVFLQLVTPGCLGHLQGVAFLHLVQRFLYGCSVVLWLTYSTHNREILGSIPARSEDTWAVSIHPCPWFLAHPIVSEYWVPGRGCVPPPR